MAQRSNLRSRKLVTGKYVRGMGGGGKGGGGTGRVAREDPDSLQSRQFARLIEAISEGEIAGFEDPDNPMRCIALEGTPIENSDGTRNFKNFDFYFLPGTQEQSFLPGFDAAANVTAENVKITTTTPWTKQFTDGSMNAVRLDVRFPRLQKQNTTNGDITGTEVRLQIEVKEAADQPGAVFVLVIDDIIRGKASNPYVRTYRIELGGIIAPWDIRITRLTDDHDETQAIQDDTYIESYSEITYGKLRYPNTAVAGISIDAEQFGSIPSRAYKMKGLIVRVPLNYDPVTRLYADTGPGTENGTWNGEWKLAHTNNPLWCYLDLATNKRYGLGNFLSDDQFNKFALYPLAQYCDGWLARPEGTTDDYAETGKHGVPDGKGGWEPRFMCNLYLQKAEDAMKVLSDMTTIWRGMHYFAEGTLNPIQDKPRDADIQFGPANVIDGIFVYSGTGRKARHTAALVSYNDQTNYSQLTTEPFEDGDAILKYGYNPLFITNLGCTSQMCARRAGKWALTAERILTDTVSFATGAEGFRCRPGWVAKITDPMRTGADWSGRIVLRTSTAMTLDTPVTLTAPDAPYRLYVTIYDLASETSKVISVAITNGAGATSVITYAAWPGAIQMPDVGTLWQVASENVDEELFRILSVTPRDESTVDIIALQYNESLYAHIDDDAPLDEPGPSVLPNPMSVIPIKSVIYTDGISIAGNYLFESASDRFEQSWLGHRITAPGITAAQVLHVESQVNLTLSERAQVTDATVEYEFSAIGVREVALVDPVQGVTRDLHIGWLATTDPYVRGYRVAYRHDNGNWVTLPEVSGREMIIEGVIPGIYDISIVVVNRFGRTSTAEEISVGVDVINPLEGASIQGLEITDQGNDTDFTTPDVQFDWRINSPTGEELVIEDDAPADPFFRDFIVTIFDPAIPEADKGAYSAVTNYDKRDYVYTVVDSVNIYYMSLVDDNEGNLLSDATKWLRAEPGHEIQAEVYNIIEPTYKFTIQLNEACIGGPFPSFKIGVKLRDRFNNVSDEAFLLVNKARPLKLLEPCNLIPTIDGMDASWTNPPDISRAKINIYKNRNPSVLPHFSSKMANAAAADATHISINGLTDEYVFMWAEAEDVFGLTSTIEGDATSALFLGYAVPGRVNDVAEATFMPDGGLAPADNIIHLAHPEEAAEIWYRVNDPVTPITNNPADGSTLVVPASGVALSCTPGPSPTCDPVEITARAYVNGLWSPPVTRTFEYNVGGGSVVVAPSFDPPVGTYPDPSGTLEVIMDSLGADAIFYKLTVDGSTPGTPTHDGATPPNPTGTTLVVESGAPILLLRGINKISALAQKTGMTDSSISNAIYNVVRSGGGLPP